ncbi:MAG: prolipoprotein diacylglyceryl transferase [Planctomycetes bacterium]|nr:prolipoprotein diacylglyceryl transferase [Planctomycetota bacterium]
MLPRLFEIPLPGGLKLPIHGYGVMIVLGFLLACHLSAREARRRHLPDFVYDLGLVMLLSGLLGGRLLYYVQHFEAEYADKSYLEFFKIWRGGLVFYGGAITGFVGGLVYCIKKGLPVSDCLDVTSPGVPVAMAFGRLGCFLNGCCYGDLCDPSYPFGVCFPTDSPAAELQRSQGLLDPALASAALPIHPTQLYQAGHDLLLAALLFGLLRRGYFPRGGGIPLLFMLYGMGRFWLEILRGDNLPTFTGLTLSQNISLALLLVFGALFVVLLVKPLQGLRSASDSFQKTS